MQIIFLVFLFLLGITTLYIGAEALVRGSVRLSRRMGVSPLIVGLTVVSFGTSAPEFVASMYAAVEHSKDIAIGNICFRYAVGILIPLIITSNKEETKRKYA